MNCADMKVMRAFKVVNESAPPYIGIALLFGLFTFTHYAAKFKIGLRLANMNEETVHNIELLKFVDSHAYLAWIYLGLIFLVIFLSQFRSYSKPISWVAIGILLVPCLRYFFVCAYLQGKMIGW